MQEYLFCYSSNYGYQRPERTGTTTYYILFSPPSLGSVNTWFKELLGKMRFYKQAYKHRLNFDIQHLMSAPRLIALQAVFHLTWRRNSTIANPGYASKKVFSTLLILKIYKASFKSIMKVHHNSNASP